MENRVVFVRKCGELLSMAKPNLLKCELKLGKNIKRKSHEPGFAPDDEYVIVTCENGYDYKINVTGNSLGSIAEAIFNEMAHK